MKPALSSITHVCATHCNEDPHSLHVARLAMKIADGLPATHCFSEKELMLLNVAAHLHDTGYAKDSLHHEQESARIVLDGAVPELDDRDAHTVAAVVLLHRGRFAEALKHPVFDDLPNRKTVLKMGAVLRVADGLDSSHVQDADILSVNSNGPRGVRIAVSVDWYRNAVRKASAKADLWSQAFGAPLEIDDRSPLRGSRPLFHGVVGMDDPVIEGCRKVMYSQFKTMLDNILRGDSEVDVMRLHDLRVSLRRLRTALRVFKPVLKETSAAELSPRLSDLSDRLGPMRDHDVWLDMLGNMRNPALSQSRQWQQYVNWQLCLKKASENEMACVVGGPRFALVMRDTARLLRVELPDLIRRKGADNSKAYAPFCAECVEKSLKDLVKSEKKTDRGSAGKMHSFRKRCRRVRYCAEFIEPLAGKPGRKLTRALKRNTSALGSLHDTDLALARIDEQWIEPRKQVLSHFRRERRKYLRRFEKAWSRLSEREFLDETRAFLRKMRNT